MTQRKKKKQLLDREIRIQKLLARGWITSSSDIPADAIPADPDVIVYAWSFDKPCYYRNIAFNCRDCGQAEVWRAEDQQWYYEVVRGLVSRIAVRCLACRRAERARVTEARRRAGHDPSL
jgi:Probable zinc-ribbon domain